MSSLKTRSIAGRSLRSIARDSTHSLSSTTRSRRSTELREPLHDEVCSRVFRIVGERLEPVEHDFEQSVLASEFHSVKGAKRREDWVRAFRGRWFPHRESLEAFRDAQETSLRGTLQAKADATRKRETD